VTAVPTASPSISKAMLLPSRFLLTVVPSDLKEVSLATRVPSLCPETPEPRTSTSWVLAFVTVRDQVAAEVVYLPVPVSSTLTGML